MLHNINFWLVSEKTVGWLGINASDLYSKGTWFKSQPGTGHTDQGFHGFTSDALEIPRHYFIHHHFPHPDILIGLELYFQTDIYILKTSWEPKVSESMCKGITIIKSNNNRSTNTTYHN
jgi:hypothetical protein